jgi:oligopeptide/dipeptide ABC transporter ATP-binding protein
MSIADQARPNAGPSRHDLLLSVQDLHISFDLHPGVLHAVRGVAIDIHAHDHVGIVGESGSGKSATALAILGLLPRNAKATGSIRFRDKELLGQADRAMRQVRGREIAMIYQDPFSALNPVLTVGRQLTEAVTAHHRMSRDEAQGEAERLLASVGVSDPKRRMRDFPHQFSGGMRQRAMIAMALAGRPKLLIADEPTTALDVTIQAQILELLAEVTAARAMATVVITHDLGIVANVTSTLHVMYAGRVVERGSTAQLFTQPVHPYTAGLIRSVPRIDAASARLEAIEGQPPDMQRLTGGCAFAPRCPRRLTRCLTDDPLLSEVHDHSPAHLAACWNPVTR